MINHYFMPDGTRKRMSTQDKHQYYKQAFRYHMKRIDKPVTTWDVAGLVGCSYSTAYRLLKNVYIGWFAWQPSEHGGHFYGVYFPPSWDKADCQAWLNAQCENGKSRAKLHYISDIPF